MVPTCISTAAGGDVLRDVPPPPWLPIFLGGVAVGVAACLACLCCCLALPLCCPRKAKPEEFAPVEMMEGGADLLAEAEPCPVEMMASLSASPRLSPAAIALVELMEGPAIASAASKADDDGVTLTHRSGSYRVQPCAASSTPPSISEARREVKLLSAPRPPLPLAKALPPKLHREHSRRSSRPPLTAAQTWSIDGAASPRGEPPSDEPREALPSPASRGPGHLPKSGMLSGSRERPPSSRSRRRAQPSPPPISTSAGLDAAARDQQTEPVGALFA